VPGHRGRGETGVMHVIKSSEEKIENVKIETKLVYEKKLEDLDKFNDKNFIDDDNPNEIKEKEDFQIVDLEKRVLRLENILDKILSLIKSLIDKIF